MTTLDPYRRLLDNGAGDKLGSACGSGMMCITYIGNAYQIIYDALRNTSHIYNQLVLDLSRKDVLRAFNYICTAFELQNDMVTDWKSGRDIFNSILKQGRTKVFYIPTQVYILTQILLQIETCGYGHVSRSTLAYIIDLFALYFMLESDYVEYFKRNLDFPDEWKQHSRVVNLFEQGKNPFYISENDDMKTEDISN